MGKPRPLVAALLTCAVALHARGAYGGRHAYVDSQLEKRASASWRKRNLRLLPRGARLLEPHRARLAKPAEGRPTELVLVGGGHAHVQVLRHWIERPVEGTRLTVVVDRAKALYSGMVPGYVAGEYTASELEIDVTALAGHAGARVVLVPAVCVDSQRRQIELSGRQRIGYDLASLDVGSSVRGLDLPGVADHALATRPIRHLVDRLEARLDDLSRIKVPRLVVVGGGAAAIELAFTVRQRLARTETPSEITVVTHSARLLPDRLAVIARAVGREAARQGIRIKTGVTVGAVDRDGVTARGQLIPADLTIWATGAAPPALAEKSPLPRDARGFIRVDSRLRVVGTRDLFAVGDCATFDQYPWVPRFQAPFNNGTPRRPPRSSPTAKP